MSCNCGGKKQNVDYQVTFKDGSPSVVVSSMPEVRMLLAKSARGGTYKIVPRS